MVVFKAKLLTSNTISTNILLHLYILTNLEEYIKLRSKNRDFIIIIIIIIYLYCRHTILIHIKKLLKHKYSNDNNKISQHKNSAN